LNRIVLALALAGLSSPALAHAFLEKAEPAAGEKLRVAPARIELHFSEALEPAFSGIAVANVAGVDMSAGSAAANGAEMNLPLKTLKPGRYRVNWRAVSVDTHRTEGKYDFLVLP
jgi:methionine-rich copper-binding protein CopC